jgi:hypothetical protein
MACVVAWTPIQIMEFKEIKLIFRGENWCSGKTKLLFQKLNLSFVFYHSNLRTLMFKYFSGRQLSIYFFQFLVISLQPTLNHWQYIQVFFFNLTLRHVASGFKKNSSWDWRTKWMIRECQCIEVLMEQFSRLLSEI